MGKKDPRVDAYIAKSADFARPILARLRDVVHDACPDVEETVKWGTPTFMYKGMLCGTAAFKAHVVLGFWKSELVLGMDYSAARQSPGLGRITSVNDLPSTKVLTAYVKKAVALNEAGIKPAARKAKPPQKLVVPPALKAALKKSAKARAAFDAFSPSHKREYAEWIAEAKGDDTRARRVKQAIEWMTNGKHRNWKYER